MARLDPDVKTYREEKRKRERAAAPLLREAKRQFEAELAAWHEHRRARRSSKRKAS